MKFKFDFITDNFFPKLKGKLFNILDKYTELLPEAKNAKILLKPNLNSNMNALTGNTTDLRLIAALIEYLQNQGYTNITIGEGTNSGFYRNNISVIHRLKIDRLAEHFGIKVIDFNHSQKVDITFEGQIKAGVAKECFETDFFINMPKLKTHFEMGMSVCLKNLMGCLVGQENKKKTHQSLAANIVNITEHIKPQLHIVDAIFSMEGLGPTRGTPVKSSSLFVGTDPYLIDLMTARYASFDNRKVATLVEAENRGIVNSKYHNFVKEYCLQEYSKPFAPPKAGPIATFIHSPKRQKYFLAIRNTPIFNFICSTKTVGHLLFLTGLRQDVFIDEEIESKSISLNKSECDKCNKCSEYCPVGLKIPEAFEDPESMKKCISCLYCFCICPKQAIKHHGTLGFMKEQLRQYDEIIRRIS